VASRLIPSRLPGHESPGARDGLILDVGGEFGGLVLLTDAEYAGVEIEVSPVGSQVNLDVQRMDDPSQRVVLAVSDQGPGIPPEQRDDIFHPFFTTKETGVGLGLALVHQMVVEHEGEITVASEVGRGSVFRVTLPVGQPAGLSLAPTGS